MSEQAQKAREAAKKAAEASGVRTPPEGTQDGRTPQDRAQGSGTDAETRATETERAQARSGLEGSDPGELKDTQVASPGMQFDPAGVARVPDGITSGPTNQPIPVSLASGPSTPDPFEFEDGESTVWGRDERTGRVIRPRRYPELENATVLVTKTGYLDDAVRNPGDVIQNYSGPLASWMQPLDSNGKPIPRTEFKKD